MEHLGQFISNHWQLWLAFVIILLITFLNELYAQKKRAKSLSPQAAVDLINQEKAKIIDLRDKTSFQNGHIIHAIHSNAADFEQHKMDHYKNQPILLVCAKGFQSQTLATKLRAQGFEKPFVLHGGIAAWQAANLPLVKGKK